MRESQCRKNWQDLPGFPPRNTCLSSSQDAAHRLRIREKISDLVYDEDVKLKKIFLVISDYPFHKKSESNNKEPVHLPGLKNHSHAYISGDWPFPERCDNVPQYQPFAPANTKTDFLFQRRGLFIRLANLITPSYRNEKCPQIRRAKVFFFFYLP